MQVKVYSLWNISVDISLKTFQIHMSKETVPIVTDWRVLCLMNHPSYPPIQHHARRITALHSNLAEISIIPIKCSLHLCHYWPSTRNDGWLRWAMEDNHGDHVMTLLSPSSLLFISRKPLMVKRCGLLWRCSRKGTHGEEDRRKPSYGYLEEWNDVYVSTVMDVFTFYWSFAIPDRHDYSPLLPTADLVSSVWANYARWSLRQTRALANLYLPTTATYTIIYDNLFARTLQQQRLGRWLIRWTWIGILIVKIIWSPSKFENWELDIHGN